MSADRQHIARIVAAIIFASPGKGDACNPFRASTVAACGRQRSPRLLLAAAMGTLIEHLPTAAWSVQASAESACAGGSEVQLSKPRLTA